MQTWSMDLLLTGLFDDCRLCLVKGVLKHTRALLLSLIQGAGVALGEHSGRLQFLNESRLTLLLLGLSEAVRKCRAVLHDRHHLCRGDRLTRWSVPSIDSGALVRESRRRWDVLFG